MERKLMMSSSPHIFHKDSINRIMLDVLIALTPALIGSVFFFGYRSLLICAVSMFSAVITEYIWQKLTKQEVTIDDFSAMVTGLLIAFNVPVSIPLWMVVLGNVFAIIVVKQFFGGIGNNFINPALAARAFLLASFPVAMTNWAVGNAADAVTSATPLAALSQGAADYTYFQLFLGIIPGCIGETSALLLLLGGLYLLIRRVINWRVPVIYIATVAVMTFILGKNGLFTGDPFYHILSGGLMLGAFFMATDYVTSPVTNKGKIIMGIGCGVITSLIRLYGSYPEGVSYSILFMNLLTPTIDKFTMPKKFGGAKE